MTPSPAPRPAKIANPASALASAEDDYREEVTAFYEVAHGSITSDLSELEAIATITARYARDMETLIGRLEYGARDQSHGFVEYLLDVVDDALDHGAGSVVRAHARRIQS